MPTTLLDDALTPILAAEQFPRILSGLVLAGPLDHSVLAVFGFPSIDKVATVLRVAAVKRGEIAETGGRPRRADGVRCAT